jgi:class 3 adenylate cyclase/tetratricopeptide (TPR) repeat protein
VADNALAPYVPRLLADWDAHASSRVRVVSGSLLSADISGFTALSERLAGIGRAGAEELTDLLNRCFDGMIATASRHGGDVLKFGGDALLILFTGADHTARACAAAVAIRSGIAQPLVSPRAGRVRLKISQGIHAGDFAMFLLEAGHRELMVTGPGATATVKCEGAASAGEIMLSPAAAGAVDPAWLGEARPGGSVLRRRTIELEPFLLDRIGVTADTDLAGFVAAAQREQIAAGVHGEHRQATVAFVKFSHADADIERDGVDGFGERLDAFASALTAAADEHGVHWLASDVYPDGGKAILTAGVPSSSGRDEDDMLHTLRALLDARPPLDLHVGVNRGPVFVGDLGSGARRTFTVMGDTVNLAARLMQTAGPGQLIASRDTLDTAHSRFELEALEPFFVKGKSQPIEASVVGRLVTSLRATEEIERAPFVGREKELQRLGEGLRAAAEHAGYAIEVVAEPGMGKSRLLQEFLRRERPHSVLKAACGQYLRATPYLAVRSMLRALVGVDADADATEAGAGLRAFVRDRASELEPWLPLLAIPIGAEVDATPEAERIAPEFRRARMQSVVVELLQRVVEPGTLLLVEDGHWIDDASRGLLIDVAGSRRDNAWLTVCTRRPGPPVFPSEAGAEELAIEPLGSNVAERLAVVLAEANVSLAPSAVAALADRAGGNPLFVIELVAAAVAQGSTASLPSSIEQLLASRIDTLAPRDRLLLRDASVLGALIDTAVLAEAIEDDTVRSPERWEPLSAFVEPEDGMLRFRHALFRAAAYEGLSYRRRAEVHGSVGRAIERQAGDSRDASGLLSLHFDVAGDHHRAWRYSVLAGEDARDKYANFEAAEFFERALKNSRDAGVDALEIAPVAELLGDVTELVGRYDDADDAYKVARKHATDEVTTARLLQKQAMLRERRGRYRDALRWLGRALRLAEQSGDPAQATNLVEIAIDYSGVRYRQGRYRECLEWARRAADEARQIGDRRRLAHALDLVDLALISYAAGRRDEVPGAALAIYEQLDDLVGQTSVLSNLALAAHQASRWNEAVRLNERSRFVAEQAGDVNSTALALCNMGEVLCDLGRVEEARAALEEARRIWRSIGFQLGVGACELYLGRTEAAAGNHDDALTLLDGALVTLRAIGATTFILDVRIRRAESLVALGRATEALELCNEAFAEHGVAEHDVNLRCALTRVRGRTWLALGDLDAAASDIDDALRMAEDAGAPAELAASLLVSSELHATTGDTTKATELRDQADEIYRRLMEQ